MKRLGVIGGLGPAATAYFLERLVAFTDAERDQDHVDAVILNRPWIPDRTAYILGLSDHSPVPPMVDAICDLERLDATALAIPCVTSHRFYDELQEAAGETPIINMVSETARLLAENDVECAGIMATSGTVESVLFQRALDAEGIPWVIPGAEGQKRVMHLIYQNVKAGRPVETDLLSCVVEELTEVGATCAILGCTELSFMRKDHKIGMPSLDALEALARASVLACDKPLSAAANDLII